MKKKKITNGKAGEVKTDIRELLRDFEPNPFGKQSEDNFKEWMAEAGYVDLQEMCIKAGVSPSGDIRTLRENLLRAFQIRNAPLGKLTLPEKPSVQKERQNKILSLLGEL